MWDVKNIVNQCVKCGCKYTSAENPLKLLTCLHSMCLNCLNGKPPASTNKSPPKDVKTNNENGTQEGNSEHGQENAKKDDSMPSDKENGDGDKSLENGIDKTSDTATTEESSEDSTLKIAEEEKVNGNANGEDSSDNSTSGVNGENSSAEKLPEVFVPVTECPICGDPIEQPGSALMDNMFAEIDPNQADAPVEDTKYTCTACDEEREANSYCQQCEEWLCDSCVDAHKRVRITRDHVIIPKDQVKVSTNKSPWEQLMTCQQHKGEPLKFFCEKCEKLTCRDCQLMDHKDHKYQFLDQAADQYKQRLKGSLALMGEKRNKLAANQEEITKKLNNCRDQKDTLQGEILHQADVLVKGIRQAVWGVLSNLASFTDAATKRLNKEIDDVKDLVTKFDHCIKFMDDILEDGSSMSLLYSKGGVESKCRKVYHTQVDPQSLKGNLQIQYRHDVNWLMGNLTKIGSIFVNGVRYPPDKSLNGPQNRQNQKGVIHPDQRQAGLSATSPHLQHMANQPIPGQPMSADWTKFIQTVSTNPKSGQSHGGPPNINVGMGGSLPPQLSLPNRRGSQAPGQGWPGVPPGIPAGSFVAGQLLTPGQQQLQQQQQAPPRPTFQPMRLHHRPATLAQFNPNESNNQNLRSPPQYRMGGEASGTSRPSSHGTPDPARPASAGMYDANANGGGSGEVNIKKEHRDTSPDCIITSSQLKADRPSVFQTTPPNSRLSDTVLEMQRNLDDVIRAVPMNISDNLEQIGGVVKNPAPAQVAERAPAKESSPEKDRAASPTAEELRENWQGGNSMPGFSLSQTEHSRGSDPNDDYCACCHNGGDVLCCDTCPKVFHLQCHIPILEAVPQGEFVCTVCSGDKPVEAEEVSSSGKRKAGMSEQEVKVCERILLELFCHPSSVPFQEPVNKVQVPNYYKIITQPVDFTLIKSKLKSDHSNHYQSIKAFLYDLRQIFINCAIYNKAGSEVGKAGKIVRSLCNELVERLIPQYMEFVKENPSPCFSAIYQVVEPNPNPNTPDDDGPTEAKRAKPAVE